MTDHLDRARAGLRLSGSLASKHGARSAFGVYGVAFALPIPQLPIGPVDLDDGMSSLAQEPGQTGAIGPGALNAKCLDVYGPRPIATGLAKAGLKVTTADVYPAS